MKQPNKRIVSKILIFTILCVPLFWSCKEDDETEAGINITEFTVSDGETVLGRKLENPYSIENMTKAIEQVRPSMLKTGEVLQPNFLYVRFLPKNYEEFELLYNDTTLSLFDVPLDYEILSEGEDFHDPSLPADQITWQYTVVPVGYSFPEVEYEILEEIYIPKAEERDIETEALIITNNYKPDTTATLKGDITPYGKIMVFDDRLNIDVPAIRVKVRANNWFRIENVYTRSDGTFQMHEKFAGKVDIRLVFENEHARIRNTVIAVSSADIKVANEVNKLYLTISRRARDLTKYPLPTDPAGFKSFNHQHTWALATVSNVIEEYRSFCSIQGIGLPQNDLRVLVLQKDHIEDGKDGVSGAAPMLFGSVYFYHINHDSWENYFNNMLYVSTSNTSGLLVSALAPDVIISFGTEGVVNSQKLSYTTFHELGHASHYKKVGNTYWNKYVNYIISNFDVDTYGDGKAYNADLCALGEMWGHHIGKEFEKYKYNTKFSSSTITILDYFNPLPKGNISDKNEGWIPYGLAHDLVDENGINIELIRTDNTVKYYDNVSGYSNKMLFDALDSDIESPSTYKNRLLFENGNLDKTDLLTLFTAYYY